MTAFDLTPPTATQTEALVAGLSSEERRVLLQHGTEAPFCGVFLDNKREGVYCCRLCGYWFRCGGRRRCRCRWYNGVLGIVLLRLNCGLVARQKIRPIGPPDVLR